MFIFLALLAFINAQNDAYIKEEENASSGESLISNDDGISSNSDNVIDDNTNSTDGSNSSINDGGASSNIEDSSVLNDGGASSNDDESSVLNENPASNDDGSISSNENTVSDDPSTSSEDFQIPDPDVPIIKPNNTHSKRISGTLRLALENLNDVLNNGISKKVFSSKYFDEPDEALNSYSYYVDIISNKSYVLFNRDGEYSRFFDAEATLYSTSRSIRDFLNDSKPAFKVGKSILSDLGPDVAKALNIDFNLIESLYNYILVNDENDGVKFGTILDKLGISKNWIPNVKKAISVFDNGTKISDLFDALGVTTQYNDFINKFSKLKVPTKEDDVFISIKYASDSIKSAITLVRTVYNNFVKTYYDDLILPIIKKYGLKPADIFESSIKTRASSLVSALDKLQKYSNACEKEEKNDLEEVQCIVFEEVIDQFKWDLCDTIDYNSEFNQSCLNNIPNTLKGYVSDYNAAEINLTNILINKYKIEEEYVGLISTMIADALDSNKNFKSILEDTTKYLGKIKITDRMTYSQLVSSITYTIDFISALSGSSDFYNVVDMFGFSEAWKNAAYFVLEISTEKPLCNLSFINEYDYEECQSYSTYVLDQMKKYLSDKSKFGDFLPTESPGFNSIIEGAISAAKLFSKTLPEFLKSAYENVGFPFLNQTFAEENLTLPKTVDFTNVITTTFDIMNELVSLVDFLFPYAARELPVVSQYYPIFIQKTQQILDAFKTSKTIPTIANTFYDGIGVIFEMIGNAANAYNGPDTLVLDVVKKATPTSFLNLQQTATKLMAIENLTLHNIADAITYDGSNNVAKLLADSRTLTINDIAPYKSLVKHSGELYTSMKGNHLTLDTISKCLAASKDGIADMLKSLISPALGYPRQFILNIVKNYLRSNDEEVGSYFDKIRRMAASVANGRLIATSTEEIVVTPAPTPAPTQKPVEPDYKPVIDTGLKAEVDGGNVTSNKEVIENLFKDEEGKKISGAVTVEVTGENFTFGDEIKLDDDQLIMIPEEKPIDYKGGQLNILFKDTSVETTIHVEDASNIQLSINSNNNGLGKKVIKIESKEATSVNIASSTSKISTPFEIKVPEKVKEVSIDAIQLNFGGTISASKTVENDKGEKENVPVDIKVSNLNADAGTKATLSKLTVKKEFNIRQTAQLDFQDVTFEDGAKINLKLESAGTENFENPIITGQIPKPPSEIILSKPEGTLYEGRDYTLFAGTFVDGCESWSNAITNLADTGFTSKKCNDPLLAQGEDKRLDLQYQPDSGKKGNKLPAGAIAGIVIGCVAVVAIVVVVVIIVIRKKKQQDASSDENGGKDDAEI